LEFAGEHPVALASRRFAFLTRRRLVRLLLGCCAAAALATCVLFRPAFLGGPTTLVIVSGHSMEPTLHAGDLVVALRARSYSRGDVIVYRIPRNQAGAGALVIHRVIGGSAEHGYLTRGDNRRYRDPWHPRRGDVVGRLLVRAPRLGLVPVLFHTPFGMAIIAALAAFLVIARDGGARPRGASTQAALREPLTRDELDTPEVSAPAAPEASPAATTSAPPEPAEPRHLLFVPGTGGYELVEREGAVPASGTAVEVDGTVYTIANVRKSPLPADDRPCAFLWASS
jgi:signal peptidase I